MPFDLKPQKDPIRSWTIKSENRRLMINGISIIQPQTLLKIKLKNFNMTQGIMFHHFHGKGHAKTLGSIGEEQFRKI